MRNKLHCLIMILCLLLQLHPIFADQNKIETVKSRVSNYRLGVGDKIRIQVYGEPDLSIETKLTDAGTIPYPVLGEIKVIDLTIGELTTVIVKGLKDDYLIDPIVTVNIVEYRPFYIDGEIKNPGAYPYQPGLTVYKAVAIAGGFTQRASRTDIYITREQDPPSRKPRPANINSPINPGDIIAVEESFF